TKRRRKIAWITFDRTGVDPLLNARDLGVAERMLADERTVVGIRFPRRHETPSRHAGNLRRAALHVGVGEQAERRGTRWVMTHRAAIGEKGRNVFGVRDRCRNHVRAGHQPRKHENTKTRKPQIARPRSQSQWSFSWVRGFVVSWRRVVQPAPHLKVAM